MLAPAALATVLPVLVARGLARQARRNHAARQELEAYLDWILADAGMPAPAAR